MREIIDRGLYISIPMWQRIVDSLQVNSLIWWLSQVFALIALVCFIWSFQIKDKIKMMLMIGHASTSLVVSAAILQNYTLAVLFGLAAIRNYVFSYTDWRKKKGKHVAKWVPLVFAGIFAAATITATTLFLTVFRIQLYMPYGEPIFNYAEGVTNYYRYIDGVRQYAYLSRIDGGLMTPYLVTGIPISFWWVELFICATLIGLIIGNILPGTLVMRLSFIGNRGFNIVNHLIFGNAIGVVIASMAIGSNVLYYIRGWRTALQKRKKCKCEDEQVQENVFEGRIVSPEAVIKKEIILQSSAPEKAAEDVAGQATADGNAKDNVDKEEGA